MKNIININSCSFKYPHAKYNTIGIERLSIKEGEHIFLRGKSGSGKSTLLNLLCGVIEPQQGSIEILGKDITNLSASQRDSFRGDNFGIIFQQLNLLPYLNVYENIELPLRFSKQKALHTTTKEIEYLLDSLEIPHAIREKKAMNLSVGEQQRVAVARALVGKPQIIIADEPTSALDSEVKERFMQLLFKQVDTQNSTLVFVSHDKELSSYFKTVYEFDDINGKRL